MSKELSHMLEHEVEIVLDGDVIILKLTKATYNAINRKLKAHDTIMELITDPKNARSPIGFLAQA